MAPWRRKAAHRCGMAAEVADEGPARARRQRDDGRRRPGPAGGPDRGGRRSRWRRVADLRRRGRRRGAHPRQRPAGRQPAGQERARRRGRAAGAAGLVRCPDPGDPRLRADERAGRALAAARRRPAHRDGRHPHPGRRRRPRLRQADQADRPVPAGRARRPLLVEHGETWEDRGEKGWRRVVASPGAAARSSTPPPCTRWSTPGSSSSPTVAAASRCVRERDGTLRGVEAVIDKDLGAALLGPDRRRRRAGHRHRRPPRGAALRHPRGRAASARVDRAPDAWPTPPRGTSPAAPWARRSTPCCRFVEQGGHRAVITDLATSSTTPSPATAAHRRRTRPDRRPPTRGEIARCPSPSKSARSRSTPSPTPASWPTLIDDGVLDADRVIAVIGKTEGNGGVNDYTRIIADRAFREVLVAKGAAAPRRSGRSRSCGPAAPTA